MTEDTRRPTPPYPEQHQEPPGKTEAMQPVPDHGEQSYKGNGRLEGKVALITGADSGIGKAVAIAFAREGAFYEWTVSDADGKKDPWHIHLPGDDPFSFAGIWAHNSAVGVTSCSIVTMPAGNPMSKLHDRQPVILDPSAYSEWLDTGTPAAKAKEMLKENLDDRLEFDRVSRDVNSSRFEGKPEINPL